MNNKTHYKNKIYYKTVEENPDYLLIDGKNDIVNIIMVVMNKSVEASVYSELQSIYYQLCLYEQTNGDYIKKSIALRKDSIVGRYILSHKELFIDDDTEITYRKVAESYLVATHSSNLKMANKILPLFMGNVSGSRDELVNDENSEVLDYILSNCNFEKYIEKSDEKSSNPDREYYVYEDGDYSKKSLSSEHKNEKVKNPKNG